MPTYEYECSACGHHLEVFQSITDKKLKKCPQCGKNKLTRLLGGGTGIIFKGTGFYETDYKKKKSSESSSSCPKADKSDSKNACSSCPMSK
ncbi:MAG TPA: zinc ribbon domain-containing protein [Candidatus Omnitrophota bacterium]|nr:zinc ribbon domain-containing protein [Candidatus Omnitrophota bacterium]HPN88264.1 zinc ribbon domain-containing protein [Candidatus Omnitrophota bacterium]